MGAAYKTESYREQRQNANEIVKIGDLVRVLEEKSQKETYLRLAQVPAVEGALVSVDPNDGAMIA